MDSSVNYAFSSGFVASETTSEWTQEWTQNGLLRGLLVLLEFCKGSKRFGARLESQRIGKCCFPFVLQCFSRDQSVSQPS